MNFFNSINRILGNIGIFFSNLITNPISGVIKLVILLVGYMFIAQYVENLFAGKNSLVGSWLSVPYHVLLASLFLAILVDVYIVELQRTTRTNGFFSVSTIPVLAFSVACWYLGPISLFIVLLVSLIQVVSPFFIAKVKRNEMLADINEKEENNTISLVKEGEGQVLVAPKAENKNTTVVDTETIEKPEGVQ